MMEEDTRGGGSYRDALDKQHQPPQPTSVTPLRPVPGQPPPEAQGVAIERLLEAMILTSTINRSAAEAYALAFKIASVAAPFGEHGPAVTKIIANLEKRLGMHLATLPNRPPPPPTAA